MPESGPDAGSPLGRGMQAQRVRLRELLGAGVPRAGWKVALNDPHAQARFGLEGCVVGPLRGDRVLADRASYAPRPESALAVEAEIALRLARDVEPAGDAAAAWSAVAGIAPAIEIVDYARPSEDLAAILEHAIFHEAVVIGAELAPAALADLAPEHPLLFRNGELARRPDPAFAPRDLAAVLLHAARFLAQHGERLLAGDRLISGSFVQPLRVGSGDAIEVDFGRIGGVRLRLAPA